MPSPTPAAAPAAAPAESAEAAAAAAAAAESRAALAAAKLSSPLYYGDYLQLGPLLACQKPLSASPHELLFITAHQTAELWFKQCLADIAGFTAAMGGACVPARALAGAVARLERVRDVLSLLARQFAILESMTPLEFLEFRDRLYPASGFQSSQFRLLENSLGLPASARLQYGSRGYCAFLSAEDAESASAAESAPSVLSVVGAWLGRLPALGAFDWWPRYEAAVRRMHEADEAGIIAGGRAATMRPEAVAAQVAELARSRAHYAALFDSAAHAEAAARGERRWPYRALQAALFITLYGEEPLLAMPARLLRALAELDEALAAWRHAHALMVQRMLGAKPGTGGSSGFAYLRATVDRHKVFADLQAVPTYLIASNLLPPLPQDVQDSLQFWAEGAGAMAGGAAAVAAAGSLPPPAAAPTPAPAPAVPMRCPAGHG